MTEYRNDFNLSRRSFMTGAAGLGLLAATGMSGLITPAAAAAADGAPNKGGALKSGSVGGSTTANLAPVLPEALAPV